MSHQRWVVKCWKLGLASSFLSAAIAFFADSCWAQITPDTTLPNNSVVTTQGNTSVITNGTRAGSNLFHSFKEFSVRTGETAHFNNTSDIQNIISRVTGGSISNIDGILKANDTANLFLLNPNGIIFGPNAKLDIGGSFVGSTASSIKFADGTFFSATNPQTTPLLTISVPIGLQFGGNVGSIQNQSQAIDISSNTVGLQVKPGKTLALVGGNVHLDGGTILAPGAIVNLGGVAGSGTVGLHVDGNNLGLSFPDEVARADVSLTNGAEVNVRTGGGGSIAINAQNFNMAGGSILRAGIASGLGSVDSKAGNIEINAVGTIKLTNGSFIANVVQRGNTIGKGGDINIQAESVSATDGSNVIASTFAKGDAGNVTINARDRISFDGVRLDDNYPSGGVYSRVENSAVGNGGNINITTGSLSITNGAVLTTSIDGQGNAGNVYINARNTVSLNGQGRILNRDGSSYIQSSGAFSAVKENGVGNGGNINVTTRTFSITNGAQMLVGTFANGSAGNVTIDASDTVLLDGVGFNGFSSGVYNQVETDAVGDGGNINVTIRFLYVTNGAVLEASTDGIGNAGSVNINARDRVSFEGEGSLINPDLKFRQSSGAFSLVKQYGIGNGGNVNVTTGSLFATNGGVLSTTIRGRGDAGNVNIHALDTVSFDGQSSRRNGGSTQSSGAFSVVLDSAIGQGGSINVNTGSLSLSNGAVLLANTLGTGNAGNVNINARDTVFFDGEGVDFFSSGAYSRVESVPDRTNPKLYYPAVGQGGYVKISTDILKVTNGAVITTSTDGQGNAGNVDIDARNIVFDGVGKFNENLEFKRQYSGAFSAVKEQGVGNGGNINIIADSLILTNGAELEASTFGRGNGGNVVINAQEIIFDGVGRDNNFSSGVFSTVDKNAVGNGGDIDITTSSLSLSNGAELSSSSEGINKAAGNIKATARSIRLDRGSISADTQGGEGNINLRSRDIILRGSKISTNATGSEVIGGNITINTDVLALAKSQITADSPEFQGGRVIINTKGIFLSADSEITAKGLRPEFNGTVEVNNLDVDPRTGLVALPIEVVDVARLIDQNLCAATSNSRFTVTGRGGLPPSPNSALNSDAVWEDWRFTDVPTRALGRETNAQKNIYVNSFANEIIEAQGLAVTAQGEVVLTASAPTIRPHGSWNLPSGCHPLSNN